MAERQTKVRLSAEVQGYVEGMHKAAQATRETGSEAEKLAQKKEAIEKMSRAMLIGGGTIAAGLTLAAKAAIEWDSAWAGVLKTVDGTPEQLEAVEQGLRGLTGILPASHTEIAAVAEAAGQLGIQTPNVVAFTKTMIDLGETTNLSSEQAAMSLARFMNIMQTSQGDVSKLGSALVGLGNNFATTESEILEMSMRLAKSGVQIGLSEGEVLGLATALSSVGIEAEAGGSAMSKVMIDIAASVEQGGDRLEMFAKTSGMTADQFAQKWKSSPAEALAAFVKGLANAEAQGGSTLGVLAELGITEVRMRDALLGSAAAADQFAGAMAMGNEEFEKNNALTDEAEKRYETTAAKLDIMRNKVVDMAIGIGEQLLPLVEGGAEAIGNFADNISGLEGPMEAFVAWGGLILGTGLLGVGLWMAAVPKIAEYKKAMDELNLTGGRLHRTLSTVGKIAGAAAAWGVLIAMSKEAEAHVTGLTNALERGAEAGEILNAAAKAQSERGWGAVLPKITISAQQTGDALRYAADQADAGLFKTRAWNDGTLQEYLSTLRLIGDELVSVSGDDLPRMQASLLALSESYGWTDREQLAFINNSPTLRKALEAAAGEMDLTTSDADILKIAFSGVASSSDEAADAASGQADALAELEGKAAATSNEVDALADAIRGLGSAQFDVREASRQLEDSVSGLNEMLVANGLNLDIATEAGRQTEAAIDDMAKAVLDQAAAIAIQTGDQEAANAALAAGRERLIDILAPYYGSRDAAAEYVNQLGLIEPEKVTEIIANTEQALLAVDAFKRSVPAVIPVSLQATWGDPGTPSFGLRTLTKPSANGNLFEYANGGGLETGIYRGGPPITRFAEPETIWEAFISGKPSERDRNRQIWVDAGERLGMGDVLKAVGSQSSQGAGLSVGDRLIVEIEGTPLTGVVKRQVSAASMVDGQTVRRGSDRRH